MELMCRQGVYPHCPQFPAVLGLEGAGVVLQTGHDVKQFKVIFIFISMEAACESAQGHRRHFIEALLGKGVLIMLLAPLNILTHSP